MFDLHWASSFMETSLEEFREAFGPDSSFSGCDFHSHFDGWLYNASRLVEPLPTKDAQVTLVWNHSCEMAKWLLIRRHLFGPGDRFQLVVGWPLHVRRTSRQIVKFGGGWEELMRIANTENIEGYEKMLGRTIFLLGWDRAIFEAS